MIIMARKILFLILGVSLAACGSSSEERAATAAEDRSRASTGTPAERSVVLFLGTSLTAGLGLEAEEAYPALIQERIDEVGLPFRAVNAGVSGETSAGGLRRIDWLLRESVAVLVLELGANDGLRGLGTDQMRANLREIIERTLAAHPAACLVIAGMEAPPNMGRSYTRAFRRVFVELADEYEAVLIPFLLDGVGGVPELNQADGLHPTAEGQQLIAESVWVVLEPVLTEIVGAATAR
jgi:acyl-CoA thioesterase-1